jgi:plastocyanin
MNMTGRSVRGVVARGSVAAILVAVLMAGGSVALAADHAVDIAGFAFSPGSVTVSVGDTVTWSNADAQNHTATADDASFDTGTIAGGTSKSVTFATAGTFGYHCKIHPSMTATVVVQAAAGGGGGAGPTVPPADTAMPVSTQPAQQSGELALLAIAALGGVVVAQRRFGHRRG